MDLLLGLGTQLWAWAGLFGWRGAFWRNGQGDQKAVIKRTALMRLHARKHKENQAKKILS